MKKLMYFILMLLGIGYLAFFAFYQTNIVTNWIELPALITNNIALIPVILVSLTLLVKFWGKGIKILLFLIVILLCALCITVYVYPDIITNIIK